MWWILHLLGRLASEAWHVESQKRAWHSFWIVLAWLAVTDEKKKKKSSTNLVRLPEITLRSNRWKQSSVRCCYIQEQTAVRVSHCREVAGQGVSGEILLLLSLRTGPETAPAGPRGCSASTTAKGPAGSQPGFLLLSYRDVLRRAEISNVLTVTINDYRSKKLLHGITGCQKNKKTNKKRIKQSIIS